MSEPRPYALITGGTSGIGLGIAQILIKDYDLALVFAKNQEKATASLQLLKNKAETLGLQNFKIELFQKELYGSADVQEVYKDILQKFDKPASVLVNSAGQLRDGLFLDSDFSQHEKLIQEHLLVSMAFCHSVIKGMYKNKFGRIINISSISSFFSKRGQSNYAAAKAGLEAFTRTLALEVAHRGVTVNAIAPGLFETPMTQDFVQKLEESGNSIRKRIPVGRLGDPQEIGHLVSFLCSQQASYITGVTIPIDGGRSLGDVSL
ncbi:MAG: SDR family oxidoreductase [Pseudobdellovibrionaceae bacterium]